jgi:hypothetical protein
MKQHYFYLFYNLRESSSKNEFVMFIFLILELSQIILIIDLIFPWLFNEVNIFVPFYYLNPILLFNMFIDGISHQECKLQTGSGGAGTGVNSINYQDDLIYKILSTFFKNSESITNCEFDYSIQIIFLILFALLIFQIYFMSEKYQISYEKSRIFKIVCYFFSFFIYLFFKTFLLLILSITVNGLIFNFFHEDILNSNESINLNSTSLTSIKFLAILLFFIFLTFFSININKYFLHCYQKNDFLIINNGNSILEMILKTFVALLLNLRTFQVNNPTVIVKILTMIMLMLVLYDKCKQFRENLLSTLGKIEFFVYLMIFSFFIAKIITTVILIFVKNSQNVLDTTRPELPLLMKILECITSICIFTFILITIKTTKLYYTQQLIQFNSLSRNDKIIFLNTLLKQLIKLSSEILIYMIDENDDRNITQENLIKKWIEDFKQNNIIYRSILTNNHKKNYEFINEFISYSNTPSVNTTQYFRKLLTLTKIHIDKFYKKITKKNSQENNNLINTSELYIIFKLIYFYFTEDKKNRADFYLKKHLDRLNITGANIITGGNNYTIGLYIILHYINKKSCTKLSEGNDDHRNEIAIKYIELNENFQHILKLCRLFLKNIISTSKETRLKLFNEKNKQFGKTYKLISQEILELQENFKKYNSGSYILIAWAFNLTFNQQFSNEEFLDQNENLFLMDQNIDKNTNFILSYENCNFMIKKVPIIYKNVLEIKNTENKLLEKNYEIIFPDITREYEIGQMKKSVAQKEVINSMIINTKNNLLINVKMCYFLLPKISEKLYLISSLNFMDEDHKNNSIIVDENGDLIYMGGFMKKYFGVSPKKIKKETIKKINVYDIFFGMGVNKKNSDTNNNNNNDITSKSSRDIKEDLTANKIKFTVEEYLQIYQKIFIHVMNSECSKFIFNLKNNCLNDNGTTCVLSFTFIKNFESKMKNKFYHFKLKFHKSDMSARKDKGPIKNNIEDVNEEEDEISQRTIEDGGGFHHFSTTGTSSSVPSTLSDGRFTQSAIYQKKKEKAKKELNCIGIIISIFNLVLIFLAIFILIFISNISTHLIRIFDTNESLRTLNSIYFNGIFHLSNIIVLDDKLDYKSLEKSLKLSNPKIEMNFTEYYQSDFKALADSFYITYTNLLNNITNYMDPDYFKNNINIMTDFYQLDGKIYPEPFITVLNYPKITLYVISSFSGYYKKIPFFKKDGSSDEQFRLMTNEQKNIVKMSLNYNNLSKSFEKVSENMKAYFLNVYNIYQVQIYVLFSVYIFSHVFTFLLYFYDAKLNNNKIIHILEGIFLIDHDMLNTLSKKFKGVKHMINLEEKASNVTRTIKKLRENYKARALEESINNGININTRTNIFNSNTNQSGSISISLTNSNLGLIPSGMGDKSLLNPIQSNNKKNNKSSSSSSSKSYTIDVYKKVSKIIIIINLIYVIYAVICFPMLGYLFENILNSQKFNQYVIDIQRLAISYYTTLKFELIFNNGNNSHEIESSGILTTPNEIFQNFNKLENLINNSKNLVQIKTFFENTQNSQLCQSLLTGMTNGKYTSNLIEICKTEPIFNSNIYTIFDKFISDARSIYYNYLSSDREESTIAEIYHSEESQLTSYISLFFIKNLMYLLRDRFGISLYKGDINSLVLFAIILFVFVILTEVVNFMLIKFKVVNQLRDSYDTFCVIEKCLKL